MRRPRGFTLIELMVVVALIGALVAIGISMSGRTYGANVTNVSEQMNWTFSLAKMRAIATQHYQRVVVTPQTAAIYQGNTTGMTAPASYTFVQKLTVPTGISVWNTSTTVQVAAGATVTQNSSLSANFDFRPDGSSTGGTVFITDAQTAKKWRVLVYRITGSSYAREFW